MPANNLKQATIIPSAEPIPNTQGTAPGWWVERDGRIMVAMPGPPRELHEMWLKEVKPRLLRKQESVILSRTFKTYGLSEGLVDEMVSPLLSSANPTLGIYAKADGIYLRLASKASDRKSAAEMLVAAEDTIKSTFGEHIWGMDDDTLEGIVSRLLREKGLSLAVMEDCSGPTRAA